MNKQIIDPARLIPERTTTPFWMEYQRREKQCQAIAALSDAIQLFLRDFFLKDLIIYPNGADKKRAYAWEIDLCNDIRGAFLDLEHALKSALSIFDLVAIPKAYDLLHYLGFNDAEYIQEIRAHTEQSLRTALRREFEQDIKHLVDPTDDTLDDLPF